MNGRPATISLSSSPSPSADSTATQGRTVRSRRPTLPEDSDIDDPQTIQSTGNKNHNDDGSQNDMFQLSSLSPRSSHYERLENGLGPGKSGPKKRFAWKKFAIAAVVLIGLVWMFGPREGRDTTFSDVEQDVGAGNQNSHNTPENHRPPENDGDIEIHKPPPHNTHTSGHPSSFEEDSDPKSTTYCDKPYSSSSSLVQWALMIDAGSTGSRIHIYKFNNCQKHPSFEYEVFKMRKGGLSDFASRPADAASSLDELMDEAVRVVPESLRSCTPVAVKATAGLRLLPETQREGILEAVERRLKENYQFKVHGPDGVVIMDGKDEGVYAWITANYLLDTIRDPTKNAETYAVLDLGGASTQIVFEPKFTKPDSKLEEGDHKYDLEFLGKKYVLYQHSYLGYGLMRARMRIHQVVEFMASFAAEKEKMEDGLEVFGNPCISKGMKRKVEIEDVKTGDKRNVTMVGEQIGSFDACNRVVELALAKDSICKVKPCSFNGVYQPSLLDTFANGKVLLLSYFFDRLDPILSGSHATSDSIPPSQSSSSNSKETPSLTISHIAALAKTVCDGEETWEKNLKPSKELLHELKDRPEYCLDLTFMHALLRLGYEFRAEKEVELGKKIQGTELGWCLGATIAMVGGGTLECKV
ncbi:Guanosine-diphosphatase [Marasmius sp. AFHP31]|nr:Guanosine-diphosphatase [Marasmius sp. AFHP31]